MYRLIGPLLLSVLLAVSGTAPSNAQDYPSRPIRLVLPYTAGGGGDALTRLLADKLKGVLNQQVIVENRPGAGTLTGTEYVARSAPDGYTLLLAFSSLTVNPVVFPNAKYDAVKDFTAIAQIAIVPHLLAVTPSINVKSVPELIALAKQTPGKLNFASSGIGSSTHLEPEILKKLAGIDMVHVPYQGGAAGITDTIAGRVQLIFGTIQGLVGHVETKALVALAVTGPRRVNAVKDAPTFAEVGLPGFDAVEWAGLFAPGGVPPAIVEKLEKAVATVLQDPEFRAAAQKGGFEPPSMTRQEFAKSLANDPWPRIASELKIKIEQ
jgi:tripartite-type tricarboxylate transporter receptor subunit TctC